MPTSDALDDGLWEIRTPLENRFARVLLYVADAHLVLPQGFIKKSRTTPKVELVDETQMHAGPSATVATGTPSAT